MQEPSASRPSSSNQENDIHSPVGYKSWVWKYFGFRKKGGQTDKTFAICKDCKCELRHSGNTTNLSLHLKRRHGIAEENVCNTRDTPASSLTTFFPEKLSHTSKRAVKITSAISYFICKDMRPYNVVENEGFRELLHTLEPKYNITSRQHFSESCILKLYEDVEKDVKHELMDAGRVAITTDGWTSCATEAYVTITCHFINTEWQMKDYVLQTRILNDTHTGVNIGTVLKEACEEWNIQEKKTALVTDNASNMSIAGKEASLSPHIKCFEHTINLTTQKGLKCAGAVRLLGRVRRIVAFSHRSTVATAVFKEKQRLLELPEHKLKHDVVTRWNSSFDMLERFLEQQAAVCASLLDRKLRKGASDVHTLSEDDITAAEEMVKLLGPVKATTTVMCEEKQPTVSVIAPLQAKLLDNLKAANEDPTLITEMKETMKRELEQCYVDVQQVLRKASALDPRFKRLPYLSEEERDVTFQCLIQEGFQRLEQKKLKTLDALFGDALYTVDPNQMIKNPRDLAQAEIVKYRETASLNLGGNVLEWWKTHQSEFPFLADLAKE
uniref:BED-type domain-containing protein n=1 Tax=Astyanax mexicanus TaxID=7994 RepID=A0A8B9HG88_ASTMX